MRQRLRPGTPAPLCVCSVQFQDSRERRTTTGSNGGNGVKTGLINCPGRWLFPVVDWQEITPPRPQGKTASPAGLPRRDMNPTCHPDTP